MFRAIVPYGLTCRHLSGDGPEVDLSEAVLPLWLGKYLLNHESVHIYQANLKQVQREHQNLLILQFITRELSPFP
jgi:hypothetical protein